MSDPRRPSGFQLQLTFPVPEKKESILGLRADEDRITVVK